MKGLTPGRKVHYVTDKDVEGEHLAATVTWVWDDEGTVNLNIDNPHNGKYEDMPDVWSLTSVIYSETGEVDTWHFIEPA